MGSLLTVLRLLRLPEGWLDGAANNGNPAGSAGVAINSELLAQVMLEVTEALKGAKVTITNAQLSELVAMQYADAAPTGRVDPARIQRLVGLLKR